MSVHHEIRDDGVLVVERRYLGAPPRLLFKAWRDDWHLQAWWPTAVKMDFKPGGKLIFSWPDKGFELRGRFIELATDKKISFTWQWTHEPDAFPCLTEVHFVEEDRGLSTNLRIEQKSFDPTEDAALIESLVEGWRHFLQRLEDYACQMTLV